MEPKYDAIILTTANDFRRLQVNYSRLITNMQPRKVIFVGNAEVGALVERLQMGGKVGFVNEDDIIPFSDVHQTMMEVLEVTELSRGVTGWYYQQFLKMQYSAICENGYYLVWDGDTVPCKPFTMFKDGQVPYLDLKREYHEDYFVTMERLLPGMHKTIEKSFISEHMLMNCQIMKNLIADIMKNENLEGDTFYKKVIHAVGKDKLCSNSFSEFETYGTYVSMRFPTEYRLRHWRSFRYGACFFHPEQMTDGDYAWLSEDFDAISFEKNQSVREDHENIFNNVAYQQKLSARQILEIAQAEFTEGYIEVWDDCEESVRVAVDANEYKIYEQLGDSCIENNVNQAYLCYENAEYLCADTREKERLSAKIASLCTQSTISVKKASIVIVSYNCEALMQQCIASIRQNCNPKSYEIVVVDNASTDGIRWWLQQQQDIKLVLSDENLGFPKGCNVGANSAAKDNDIFLLNNDTCMTHNALFWLRMGLYHKEKVGAVGCVANFAGNDQTVLSQCNLLQQHLQYAVKNNVAIKNPYEERNRLCGFAMLIQRDAWDKSEGMDEDFSPGYFDDDDLSERIRALGYELYICHNSYIYHAGSQSFGKRKDVESVFVKNYIYFQQKWGYNISSNSNCNQEAIAQLGTDYEARISILEVGAGCGSTLARIQRLYPNATAYGFEKNAIVAERAIKSVEVYHGDWQTMQMPFPERFFDYIIYTKRDEEECDMELFRTRMAPYVKKDGRIIISTS